MTFTNTDMVFVIIFSFSVLLVCVAFFFPKKKGMNFTNTDGLSYRVTMYSLWQDWAHTEYFLEQRCWINAHVKKRVFMQLKKKVHTESIPIPRKIKEEMNDDIY